MTGDTAFWWRLQEPMRRHRLVNQAAGVLMQWRSVDCEGALTTLEHMARAREVDVVALAQAVVEAAAVDDGDQQD
ncbi:ANTAR domain-containing protein [Pedococcus sp. 5OH_020]|uniref:ANTAR domain-containing protein n=1 Tax=Pedococcus sp. 5OH_020 TaxID=2989814 RepID=UPI0022E9FC07|nr:ANTAR domain-containing protein [Pedococcus sp. 5OH_020]